MSLERHAYEQGARACHQGLPASANPYQTFALAAAYALGWAQAAGPPPAEILWQAHVAGIIDRLPPSEGGRAAPGASKEGTP